MTKIYFEDLKASDEFWGDEVAVERDEMLAYNQRNDPWPIHVDEEAAARSPFGGVIASGGYTITLMYRSLIGAYNTPERQWEFLGGLDWKLKFLGPVRPGDRLRTKITVTNTRPSSKPGRGIVNNLNEVINQNDDVVMTLEVVCLLATRPVA